MAKPQENPAPDTTASAHKKFEDVHNVFYEALREAYSPAEAQNRAEEATRDYLRELQEANAAGDMVKCLQAQYEYARRIREISFPEELRTRIRASYAQYLAGMREAFKNLDERSATPALLTAVAGSLAAVATHAAPALQLDRSS